MKFPMLRKRGKKKKILFYGNCQTMAAMNALQLSNKHCEFEYASNTVRYKRYDPERTEKLMNWCDFIVSQPVMNKKNNDYYEKLSARFGEKLLFMPYVFFDGLFSLCEAPAAKGPILGHQPVLDSMRKMGFRRTHGKMRTGKLKFPHAERLKFNFEEMERREQICQIRVKSYIEDNYRDRQLMTTHNHPRPEVINHIAAQIAEQVDLDFKPVTPDDPLGYFNITLPETTVLLSPYTAKALGLNFMFDIHWARKGKVLLKKIAADNDIPLTS